MKPCMLCGATEGRATVEHVIPQWARRSFDTRGPIELFAAEASGSTERRQVDALQHLNIKLRGAICHACNTGPLSRLEAAVRPILAPMIVAAQPATINPLGQARLATWAVKTVLLFELAMRQKYPGSRPIVGYMATGQEFAWLWAKEEPPPRSLVWLGCWDCQQTTPVMYEPSSAVLPTPDGHPIVGHLTTLSLGFVALQVFTVDFVAADLHQAEPWNGRVPPSLEQALTRIWPAQPRDLAWPSQPFANEDWSRLISWDGVLRPASDT